MSDELTRAVGVDGCRGGWIAVHAAPDLSGAEARFWPSLAGLIAAEPDAMIVIDMPIGLAEGREGRQVDKAARARLGPRRSSVFPPPCRAALNAPDYPTANAIQKRETGKGLSKQAWMIAPKMREADGVVTPSLQARIREGHPELAFATAAGAPMTAHKTKLHGLFERLRFLHDLGFDPAFLAAGLPAGTDAAPDDLIDACILAHVASRCLRGEALRLTEAPLRDGRGLTMEMWV